MNFQIFYASILLLELFCIGNRWTNLEIIQQTEQKIIY